MRAYKDDLFGIERHARDFLADTQIDAVNDALVIRGYDQRIGVRISLLGFLRHDNFLTGITALQCVLQREVFGEDKLEVCILLVQPERRRQVVLFGIEIAFAVHREIEIALGVGYDFDIVVFRFGVPRIEGVLDLEMVRIAGYEVHLAVRRQYLLAVMLHIEGLEVLVEAVGEAIDDGNDIPVLSSVIKSGLDLFEKMYGYAAVSFCPPCGIVNSRLFKTFEICGVKNLQAGQYISPEGNGKTRHFQYHWGHRNQWGQIFTRRNCTFEPARNHNIDWVDRCMKEIEIAFRWGKPACINTHRVSYISRIYEENRDNSLRQLKKLLAAILNKWPDAEFISSEQLYYIMREQ